MDIQGKFGNDADAYADLKRHVSFPLEFSITSFGPDRDRVTLRLTEGLGEVLLGKLRAALDRRKTSIDVERLYDNAQGLLGTDRGENIEDYNSEYARAILELVGDLDPEATGATRARLQEVAERLNLDIDKLY